MKRIRKPTWALGRVCGAVLTAVAVAVITPAASAGDYVGNGQAHRSGYHFATHGNTRVGAEDTVGVSVTRYTDSAFIGLDHFFKTRRELQAPKTAFWFHTRVNYGDAWGGTAYAFLLVPGDQGMESVLPPVSGDEDEFVLQEKLPTYSYDVGAMEIAVGGATYEFSAPWQIDLDLDLAGHAFSVTDTKLAGQLRAEARFAFVIWLPGDVMLEDGYALFSRRSNPPGMFANTKPPAHFDSLLSCDLRTSHSALMGIWCLLQQASWELKLRLIPTATVGGLAYTRTDPIVDDEIPAVNKYLIDTRFGSMDPKPSFFGP